MVSISLGSCTLDVGSESSKRARKLWDAIEKRAYTSLTSTLQEPRAREGVAQGELPEYHAGSEIG